jgi:hypothetical protein
MVSVIHLTVLVDIETGQIAEGNGLASLSYLERAAAH